MEHQLEESQMFLNSMEYQLEEQMSEFQEISGN